jgi:hypothetical protein
VAQSKENPDSTLPESNLLFSSNNVNTPNFNQSTRKGYLFNNVLFSPPDEIYNRAFYFDLNKFEFFKSSQQNMNEMFIYFLVSNYNQADADINIAYCNSEKCLKFHEFSSYSTITVNGQSFKQIKISIKSDLSSPPQYRLIVNTTGGPYLLLTDFTIRVSSNSSNIGVTNFRIYIRK